MTMKKTLLVLASLLLGVLLFVFAFQHVGWREIQSALLLFPWQAVALIFLINFLAVFLVGSYRWWLILRAQGCSAGYLKVVKIKLAGFSLSYVTPSAFLLNEPVRAYMIKEEAKCGWDKSFASVIVDQTVLYASLLLAMIAGFAFLAQRFTLSSGIYYGFLALLIASLGMFYLFFRKIVRKEAGEQGFFTYLIHKIRLDRLGWVRHHLGAVESTEQVMTDFFRHEKKSSAAVIALGLLEALLDVSVVYFVCFYLGHPTSVFETVGIFSFVTFASLIPIPAALGSFEVMLTLIFQLFGFGKENGLAFSLIYRFVNVAFCGIGLGAFLHFMLQTASHAYSREAPPFMLRLHRTLLRLLGRRE